MRNRTVLLLAILSTACPPKEEVPVEQGLILDPAPIEGALAGRMGDTRFLVFPSGDAAAHARFELPGKTILVEIDDATHGSLTINGVTLDGDGVLSAGEDVAVREIAAIRELAAIPLELACREQVEPRAIAALLMPWQATLKYVHADRNEQVRAIAANTSCRHFNALDETRPAPKTTLLADGRSIPAAYGHLPFDVAGALPAASRRGLATDLNVYGPGGSMCRGACGPDCEPNNCGEPVEEWRCEQNNGKNTGRKELWYRYTCGEHPGCIEHDACFDSCNDTHGFDSWDAAACMRVCDYNAASGYSAAQGIEWALGNGPFTHKKNYDYDAPGDPIRDEQACPIALTLIANPGSGLAPHMTTLRWEGLEDTSGDERCRLDYGDGTEVITIEPCAASGEVTHTYAVPSDMRYARGVYVASLTRVGQNITATTDVEASWTFDADPKIGPAPLVSAFSWDGFALVGKPLSCTIDFGDDSAPETIENCALQPGFTHSYEEPGLYQVSLTVRGEDRPVTKILAIEVRGEEQRDCAYVRDVEAWTGRASFSYNASGSDGRMSITHNASGMIEATIPVYVPGEHGMSFMSTSPGGTVQIRETALWLDPNRENPNYDIAGNGTPLPPETSVDGGSNFAISFDLDRCMYNVHVQALLAVTITTSDDTSEGQYWVVSFQTPWRPVPADGVFTDSGEYDAHSPEYIFAQPGLIEYYAVHNFDLVDILGEGGLGAANVSWQIWRE